MTLSQSPELCWEIGHHVVELSASFDVQLLAIVKLIKAGHVVETRLLVFHREEIMRKNVE